MQFGKLGADRKMILSTIWIFYLVNILYADVLTIMGSEPSIPTNGGELIEPLLSPAMFLGAAIFLETAMIMIVLSRLLTQNINRWANIVVALMQGSGVTASLFVGTATMDYIFFVAVEVTTCLFIVWYAWTWKKLWLNDAFF